MNRKVDAYLINAHFYTFNDEKGELVELTKIKYSVKGEDTSEHLGDSEMECSYKGNLLSKFQGLTSRKVTLEIKEQNLKNGVKFIVTKVNNIVIVD